MVFYISLYIFLTFLAIFSYSSNRDVCRLMGIIAFIIILCVQGFRWRTGTDWDPYFDAFTKPNTATDYAEAGYLLINRIIGYFTNSYTLFLLIQCGFGMFSTYRFARFFKVDNLSMIFLYSFASTIFPIRMTTAIAIYLFSYQYIVKRELIKYLIFAIVAISIHSASIVALPSYFLVNRTYKDKTLILAYLGSCFIGLLSKEVFSGILNVSLLFYNSAGDLAQRKLIAYVVETEDEGLSIISYLNALFFILFFLWIRKQYFINSVRYNVILNMYVLGICFNRLVSGAIPYLARTTAFFAAGFIVMLLLWTEKQRPSRRVAILVIISLYAATMYFKQLDKFSDVFIPYYSVFSSTTRTVVY